MSQYISEKDRNFILSQIANLETLLAIEKDPERRRQMMNEINGLKQRLTYGANPDRGI